MRMTVQSSQADQIMGPRCGTMTSGIDFLPLVHIAHDNADFTRSQANNSFTV